MAYVVWIVWGSYGAHTVGKSPTRDDRMAYGVWRMMQPCCTGVRWLHVGRVLVGAQRRSVLLPQGAPPGEPSAGVAWDVDPRDLEIALTRDSRLRRRDLARAHPPARPLSARLPCSVLLPCCSAAASLFCCCAAALLRCPALLLRCCLAAAALRCCAALPCCCAAALRCLAALLLRCCLVACAPPHTRRKCAHHTLPRHPPASRQDPLTPFRSGDAGYTYARDDGATGPTDARAPPVERSVFVFGDSIPDTGNK
jgi:hypothetical protein